MLTRAIAEPGERPPSDAARRAPGRPQLIELILPAAVCAFALVGLRPLRDPDVWWHLRSGEELLRRQEFLSTVPLDSGGRAIWIKHDWAADVLFAVAQRIGGLAAVIVLHVGLLALVAATVAWVARRHASVVPATAVALLAMAALVPYAAERPQLLSFALLPVFAHVLVTSARSGRVPWILVPLLLLWSWSHGLWVAAMVTYAAWFAGLAWEYRRLSRLVPYAVVGLGLAAVVLVTPLGWRVYQAPLEIAEIKGYVAEWSRPSPFEHPWLLLPLVMLLVVVAGWWATRVVRPSELAIVSVAVGFGTSYVRGLPVAALLLLPLAAQALEDRRRARGSATDPPSRAVGPLLAAGLAAVALAVTVAPHMRPTSGVHDEAIAHIRAVGAAPHVLTEDTLGSRLLWFLPTARPSIDGRLEVFSEDGIRAHLRVLEAKGNWEDTVLSQEYDVAWLHRGQPLARALQTDLGWQPIYADDDTIVLAPEPPA